MTGRTRNKMTCEKVPGTPSRALQLKEQHTQKNIMRWRAALMHVGWSSEQQATHGAHRGHMDMRCKVNVTIQMHR